MPAIRKTKSTKKTPKAAKKDSAKLIDSRRDAVNQLYVQDPSMSKEDRIEALEAHFGEDYSGADKKKLRGLMVRYPIIQPFQIF